MEFRQQNCTGALTFDLPKTTIEKEAVTVISGIIQPSHLSLLLIVCLNKGSLTTLVLQY